MEHAHKVDVPLAHRVELDEATKYLLYKLDCDSWYVACHHEHLFVLHLTKGEVDQYAARFECNPPVEKGVFHTSRAWSLSIVPLAGQENLSQSAVKELRTALAALPA